MSISHGKFYISSFSFKLEETTFFVILPNGWWVIDGFLSVFGWIKPTFVMLNKCFVVIPDKKYTLFALYVRFIYGCNQPYSVTHKIINGTFFSFLKIQNIWIWKREHFVPFKRYQQKKYFSSFWHLTYINDSIANGFQHFIQSKEYPIFNALMLNKLPRIGTEKTEEHKDALFGSI